MTTNQEPQSSHLISSLSVTELETLITKIVKKVMREEINRTKVIEEITQLPEAANSSDYNETPRPYGMWRGQVRMSDDFDVLPESIAAAFAGEME